MIAYLLIDIKGRLPIDTVSVFVDLDHRDVVRDACPDPSRHDGREHLELSPDLGCVLEDAVLPVFEPLDQLRHLAALHWLFNDNEKSD